MSEIKEVFVNAFPAGSGSAEARSLVVEMARQADRNSFVRVRRTRLGLGFGMASIAVVASIVLIPSISKAAYLRRLGDLVKDARSAHIVEWSPRPDGTRVKAREMWYEDGRWRVETANGESVILTGGGKKWVYTPSRKSVSVSSLDRPFMGGGGFSMTSMLADKPKNADVQIETRGAMKRLSMANPIDHSLVVMWVDSKTDYPVRGAVQASTRNGSKNLLEFECEFNGPVAADRFTPDFPKGTKVVDMVGGLEFWKKELAKSLAAFSIPERDGKVVFRNVQVSDRGDVFVLYTGSVNISEISLTDNQGTTYVACDGFQPQGYVLDTSTNRPVPEKGIRVEGQILQGGWWTPILPLGGNWKSRTLRFAVSSVSYLFDQEKAKRWPKDVPVPITEMTQKTVPVGTWSLRLDTPTCELIPDYMPYMAMGPNSPFDLERGDDNARVSNLLVRERYAEAERIQRKVIRDIENHEAQSGQTWSKSSFFYNMYLILNGLGRRSEAAQWLRRIEDEPSGTNGDPRIEAALRSLAP